MTGDDHVLARDLAGQAGQRLLELRAQGGDPGVLRKAGDRLSHDFLTAELAARRPGDVVLSEEGADNPARLSAERPMSWDPAAYVLRDFSAAERKDLPFLIDRAADATEALMARGLGEAQNTYHEELPG